MKGGGLTLTIGLWCGMLLVALFAGSVLLAITFTTVALCGTRSQPTRNQAGYRSYDRRYMAPSTRTSRMARADSDLEGGGERRPRRDRHERRDDRRTQQPQSTSDQSTEEPDETPQEEEVAEPEVDNNGKGESSTRSTAGYSWYQQLIKKTNYVTSVSQYNKKIKQKGQPK